MSWTDEGWDGCGSRLLRIMEAERDPTVPVRGVPTPDQMDALLLAWRVELIPDVEEAMSAMLSEVAPMLRAGDALEGA